MHLNMISKTNVQYLIFIPNMKCKKRFAETFHAMF